MTLRALEDQALGRALKTRGILIDLRPIDDYLARHRRASIPLLFEAGPGLGGRARDLIPLDSRLVLLEDGTSPLEEAAASLRGKGFEVVGYLAGGSSAWPESEVAGTPDIGVEDLPQDLRLLDVADPGTLPPDGVERIPAERLWERAEDLDRSARLGVLAGWGVRAAAAVGILERLGFTELVFVRTRPPGAKPPMATTGIFRTT